MTLYFTAITLLISLLLGDTPASLFILSAGQISIIVQILRARHLTGASAFLFLSALFFGIRPIYIFLEKDTLLFDGLFLINPSIKDLTASMWWATLASVCFALGAIAARNWNMNHWKNRLLESRRYKFFEPISSIKVVFMLIYQVLSLGIMFALAKFGRNLYDSALGAYIYDLPVVLQAGHIFGIALIFDFYLRKRNLISMLQFGFSCLLFLALTYLMRDVSIFRSFYLSGVLASGIVILARLRPNVRAYWLIVPFIILLPIFRTLGGIRNEDNKNLSESIEDVTYIRDNSLLTSYWHFYDGNGDMNIYDTFVAAYKSEPSVRPYAMSWIYVPFHLIPRTIWESKPEKGILQDMSFTNGAPYCPGIAGFFLLDGGKLWMIGCMALLGFILSFIDWTILTMRRGVLRYSLYGLVVVYGMLFSRLFLWQYFYGLVYTIIPCYIFAVLLGLTKSKSGVNSGTKLHIQGKSKILTTIGTTKSEH